MQASKQCDAEWVLPERTLACPCPSAVLYRWEKNIPPSMRPLQSLATVAHGLFAAFCNNFFAIGFIVSAQALARVDCCSGWFLCHSSPMDVCLTWEKLLPGSCVLFWCTVQVLTAKDTFTAWAGLYYTAVWIPALIMAIDMASPKSRKPKVA